MLNADFSSAFSGLKIFDAAFHPMHAGRNPIDGVKSRIDGFLTRFGHFCTWIKEEREPMKSYLLKQGVHLYRALNLSNTTSRLYFRIPPTPISRTRILGTPSNFLAYSNRSCHQSRVRLVPLLLALLTLAAPLLAQEQEQKLWDRLNRNPQKDKEMVFDTRQASFSSSRSFNSKSANSKGFLFKQKFSAGEYRSKEYAGTKSAWSGDFKFSARQANTRGKFEVPNASRQVNTKTMDVADARESAKGMPTRDFAGQRPYLKRGASQDRLDREGPGFNDQHIGTTSDLRPMTIDDIRELLNKNK
jgi:hypothetical protein